MVLFRFIFVFILSLLLSKPVTATLSEPIQQGTPVEKVLRQFQTKGMKILYSSRLVNSQMTVKSEPKSDNPRKMLEQVLRPHGLKIASGPEGLLLVVRDFEKNPARSPDSIDIRHVAEQINVPFVTVYITAKDSGNRYLTNLTAQDLILKEDGVEQKITEFINFADAAEFPEDSEPLSVMLLVDSSASMNDMHAGKRKYDFVVEAAQKMIDQVEPNDQVMVLGFNQTSWVISELTSNKSAISEKLMQPAVLTGRTALYDVLATAVTQMHDFPGRRVLVLCSDGQDSASKTTLDELIKFLQTTDVTIFVLGTDHRLDVWHKGRDVLKKISDASGGYAFHSNSEEELSSSIDKVRITLRSQYAAGYIPPYPTVHKWRRIKIECKVPGVKLRYRGQYLF
jgi:Ca-activated chloride channel homolog